MSRVLHLFLQVARYSALILGITYGILHQGTLQTVYDGQKVSRPMFRAGEKK